MVSHKSFAPGVIVLIALCALGCMRQPVVVNIPAIEREQTAEPSGDCRLEVEDFEENLEPSKQVVLSASPGFTSSFKNSILDSGVCSIIDDNTQQYVFKGSVDHVDHRRKVHPASKALGWISGALILSGIVETGVGGHYDITGLWGAALGQVGLSLVLLGLTAVFPDSIEVDMKITGSLYEKKGSKKIWSGAYEGHARGKTRRKEEDIIKQAMISPLRSMRDDAIAAIRKDMESSF